MKDLIDISDLRVDEIDELIETTKNIMENKEQYSQAMKGKILATLFYEPSTRTRLSFSSAMMYLGGNVIGFSDASTSSVSKGESLRDTIRIVSSYSDIIALRSPIEGAALAAADVCDIPVINAGDGQHAHPTQTLADLATIKLEAGRLNGLTIGICGDLKYGRTTHSLLAALSRYNGNKFVLISPKELKMPATAINKHLNENNITYIETDDLNESLPELDILYMTRIQQERFDDKAEYEKLKNSYILTADMLKNAKKDMLILHPLPRVNEISVEVDEDDRAMYFKQARYGRLIRMALILKLLGKKNTSETQSPINFTPTDKYICTNPKCVVNSEKGVLGYVIHDPKELLPLCAYCEKPTMKK